MRLSRSLIIFALLLFTAFLPPVARAQEGDVSCIQDEHENDFSCSAAGVANLCDEQMASITDSFYMDTYCDISKNIEPEIYQAVAHQLNIENQSVIDELLADNASVVEKILKLEIAASDLPPGLKEYDLLELSQKVRQAYDKEKIIQHMKRSLKNEFAAGEVWYNATDFDASMDLIIDLNVIERILFGSGSEWTEEVYAFPREGAPETSPLPAGGASVPVPPSVASTPGVGDDSGASTSPPVNCVSDDVEPPPFDPTDAPPACGDNRLDKGEQCDDGNRVSGDGCNSVCGLEDLSSLMCRDTEAVTFKKFQPPAPTPPSGTDEEPTPPPAPATDGCPPGSHPAETTPPSAPAAPQSPNYPGPNVGGVMQNYPPSNRPDCPTGMSRISAAETGSDGSAGAHAGEAEELVEGVEGICIPTEFCADMNAARDFLFPGWQQDEEKSKLAMSIEALFCLNIKKENRPLSVYEQDESCTDCHIRAMADTLEEMMQKNVAPLQDTTNASAISSRWFPNVAFNLNVAVKSKIPDAAEIEPFQKKSTALDEALARYTGNVRLSVDEDDTSASIVAKEREAYERQQKQYQNELKAYKGNAMNANSTFVVEVGKLLDAWESSFSNIQNVYTGIASVAKFREKKQCEF